MGEWGSGDQSPKFFLTLSQPAADTSFDLFLIGLNGSEPFFHHAERKCVKPDRGADAGRYPVRLNQQDSTVWVETCAVHAQITAQTSATGAFESRKN